MAQVVRSRQIHASPDAIWDVRADFGAIGAWAPNVDHSALTTDAAQGVGATRRVQVGRNVLLEQVVDWQPGDTVAYEIRGLPKVVRRARNRWRLVGSDTTTEVTLSSEVDAGSRPPQKLVAAVVARVLARASDQLLDGLAAHLEGSPHA